MIVADPRWTETADIADLHLPLRPGSDIALLNAMLHVLWQATGCSITRFVADAHVGLGRRARGRSSAYPPERAAALTGLSAGDHRGGGPPLRARPGGADPVEHGRSTRATWARTRTRPSSTCTWPPGQIGRPGAGPFSLTGQPNAMGGRETGGLAHLLPGLSRRHRRDGARRRRAALGRAAGPDRARARALGARDLRGAGVAARSARSGSSAPIPAASMPDLDLVEKALRQAELVIVQDAYHPTETTRFADVLLPAAQWPEKDGVMTNSERRLTYLPKLVEPPGEALPDAVIIARFAARDGLEGRLSPTERAADIFDEFAALTAGTPCDYSGVSHARLRAEGPLQWPVPAPDHPGTERLYTDGALRRPRAAARASSRSSTTRPSSRPTRDYPADPHHGARARSLAHAHADRQVAGPDAPHAGAPARGQSPRRPRARGSATATSWRSPRGAARRWRRPGERAPSARAPAFCPSTGAAASASTRPPTT